MKRRKAKMTEMLILPDGRILAHQLTPEMAALLADLNPKNQTLKKRIQKNKKT